MCNTQSELHPLEEGKHAAESGLSIRSYAETVNKPHTTLADKIKGWKVLDCTHVRTVDEQALFNEWRHNQVDNPHGVGEFEDYLKDFHAGRTKRLDIARDSWRNLAEIHAAPKWLITGRSTVIVLPCLVDNWPQRRHTGSACRVCL